MGPDEGGHTLFEGLPFLICCINLSCWGMKLATYQSVMAIWHFFQNLSYLEFESVECNYATGIGGTRNTSCAIWCLEIKTFFDYKMLHDGWKTIVIKGDLDNINNRVFKLPRLAHYDLHKKIDLVLK